MGKIGILRIATLIVVGLLSFGLIYFAGTIVVLQFTGGGGYSVEKQTTVQMSFWGGELEQALEAVAEDYRSIHPDRVIDLDLQPGREYEMWMRVQILGKRPPTIMQAQWATLDQYIRAGKLKQVDRFLDQINPYTGDRWRDMYYQGRLNSVRDAQNNLYIIPINQVKTAIFYNKNIFQRCRVAPPQTFQELLRVSERLRQGGYIPMGVGNVQPAELVVWNSSVFFDSVYRDEIPLLDTLREDGRVDTEEVMRGYHLGIIDPEEEQYKEMWRVFKVWSKTWNSDFNGVHGNIIRRDFLDQKIGMILTGCWMVQHLKQDIADLAPKSRFEFGVFPMPNITEETSEYFHTPLGSVGSVGMGFVISSTAFGQELTAAIDWLRYLTSPEVVTELQGDATMLPCIHGVPIRPEMEGFRPLMDGTFPDLMIQEGRIFPDAEALDAWFSLFQSYMGGTLDLDEFSSRWKKECLAGVRRTTLIEAYDASKW